MTEPHSEQQGFLHTAIRAAQAAARIHQQSVGRDLGIDTKSSEIDLVTRVDQESETRIREILLSSYPDHVVLGEEQGQAGSAPLGAGARPLSTGSAPLRSGSLDPRGRPTGAQVTALSQAPSGANLSAPRLEPLTEGAGARPLSEGNAPYRWIVDPLDGTLNYAHGFPFYCVSIGLEVHGQIEVGVVLDSVHNELFTAVRGGGAFRNGAPIKVTTESELRQSMLATGFAYKVETALENVEIFGRMMGRCRALRRPGAAALDLAYVACGRIDGFWELDLNPWDVAAGVLLIKEAGGRVTGGTGQPYRLGEGVLVATNGPLHDTMLAALELPAAWL